MPYAPKWKQQEKRESERKQTDNETGIAIKKCSLVAT
jgi:hypothetical protein